MILQIMPNTHLYLCYRLINDRNTKHFVFIDWIILLFLTVSKLWQKIEKMITYSSLRTLHVKFFHDVCAHLKNWPQTIYPNPKIKKLKEKEIY